MVPQLVCDAFAQVIIGGIAAGIAEGKNSHGLVESLRLRLHQCFGGALLARFLDEGLLLGHDAVFVVHGHGTGALRAALRQRLAGGHPAVKLFRPGEGGEGGDGVTVISLRD